MEGGAVVGARLVPKYLVDSLGSWVPEVPYFHYTIR